MLMVYIIAYEGIPDMERRKLLENAKLSLEETQAITNLSILGVKLSSATSKREGGRYSHWGSYAIEAKKNKETYDLSRYVPLVKRILEVIH
jgi:syntaxin-binding protein 1